ncbi:unnamed protein product [Alopecurus aequalis]
MKLNRVRRRRRDLQKAAIVEEDRLSKLPNDVLINILERVDTLDAIRTCILNKKLHNLLTILSQIVVLLSPRDLFRMNGVVASVTNKMLQTRSPHITIRQLKVRFILRLHDCLSIGKSVALAMAAAEFEISTQTSADHCTQANLLYFAKQFTKFLADCPDAFSGLTRFYTVLKVEHARLVELDITFGRFASLELSFLPKLEQLTYDNWPCDRNPLVLGFVPLLSKLNLNNPAMSDKTLSLSNLLANAPSISELHLDFQNEKIWVRPECPKLLAPVLDKVRIVSVENIREGCDIAWTMFILEAAPSLEELCVTVSGHKCPIDPIYSEKIDDVKWEPSVADRKHKNLAKLTIHGFQSNSNFTGYVRRIMEAAVNIKEVSLHDWKICQCCTDRMLDIKDFSSYPRTGEEKDLLREKITEGLMMASPAVIHFRPPCYDTVEVKCF